MFVAIAEFLQLPHHRVAHQPGGLDPHGDDRPHELILVDEMHLLADAADASTPRTTSRPSANDCPATIVYAGIDAWNIMNRHARRADRPPQPALQIRPFNYTTTEERACAQRVAATTTPCACFRPHPRRTAALATTSTTAPRAHRALSYLVCIAAQEAISDGTERITRAC